MLKEKQEVQEETWRGEGAVRVGGGTASERPARVQGTEVRKDECLTGRGAAAEVSHPVEGQP